MSEGSWQEALVIELEASGCLVNVKQGSGNARPSGKLLRFQISGRGLGPGGDEFLGILPGVDLKEANSVAERMKQELEQASLTIGNDTIYLQASIGVASISEGLSGLELLEKADERMYYSKRRFRRVQSLTSLEASRRVANRLSQMF